MTEKRDVIDSGVGKPIQKSIRDMIDIRNGSIEKKAMVVDRDVSPIHVTRTGVTADERRRFDEDQMQALTDSVANHQKQLHNYNADLYPAGSKPLDVQYPETEDLFDNDTDLFEVGEIERAENPIPRQNVPDGAIEEWNSEYRNPGKYGGRAMFTDVNGDADPEEDIRSTSSVREYHEPTDQDLKNYKNEMREFAGDSGYWGVHEEMKPSEYLQAEGSDKIDPKEFRPLNRWKDTDDALGDDIDMPIGKSGDGKMVQKSGNEGSVKSEKPADADSIRDTGKTNGKQNVQGDWVSTDESKEVSATNIQPAKNPIKKTNPEDAFYSQDSKVYYDPGLEPYVQDTVQEEFDKDRMDHDQGMMSSIDNYMASRKGDNNFPDSPDPHGYPTDSPENKYHDLSHSYRIKEDNQNDYNKVKFKDYPTTPYIESYSNDIDEFGMAKSFDQRVSEGLAYANATGELPSLRTIMKADLGEGLNSPDIRTVKRTMKNDEYSGFKPRGKEIKPKKPMIANQANPEMDQAEPRGDYLNTTNKDRLTNPEHAPTMEGKEINPDKTNVRPDPIFAYDEHSRGPTEIPDRPKAEVVDHTNYTNPLTEGIPEYTDPADIDYSKPRRTPSQMQVLNQDRSGYKDVAAHQGTGKPELSSYDIAAQKKAQAEVEKVKKKLTLEARKLFGGPGLEGRRGTFINNGVNNYIIEHNLGRVLNPEGITDERAQQMKDDAKQSAEDHMRLKAGDLTPDEQVNQQVQNAKYREEGLKANEEEAKALAEERKKEREAWAEHVGKVNAQKQAAADADAQERKENLKRNTASDFESLNDPDRVDRALQEQFEAHRAQEEKRRKRKSAKDKAKAQDSKAKDSESPVKNEEKKSSGSFRDMLEHNMIEKASERGYPSPFQVHVRETTPVADTYRVVTMGDGKDFPDMTPRQANAKTR